jgi:hypothetical protein
MAITTVEVSGRFIDQLIFFGWLMIGIIIGFVALVIAIFLGV